MLAGLHNDKIYDIIGKITLVKATQDDVFSLHLRDRRFCKNLLEKNAKNTEAQYNDYPKEFERNRADRRCFRQT